MSGGPTLYHFTDTARLPWILAAGELRPSRNRIGGFPREFVWATTNEKGDRTASAARDEWCTGLVRRVRFTVRPEDFFPWSEVTQRFPEWTPDQIARLEVSARRLGETAFAGWRCRAEPLPLDRVLRLETKTWSGPWQELPRDTTVHVGADGARVVIIGDRIYRSILRDGPSGAAAYTVQCGFREPERSYERG